MNYSITAKGILTFKNPLSETQATTLKQVLQSRNDINESYHLSMDGTETGRVEWELHCFFEPTFIKDILEPMCRIAPLQSAIVYCTGEDGAIWRYCYSAVLKTWAEEQGTVVYENHPSVTTHADEATPLSPVFDIVLKHIPTDEAVCRKDMNCMYDKLAETHAFFLDIQGEHACAMGLIGYKAAEEMAFNFKELNKFICNILNDMQNENENNQYTFLQYDKDYTIYMAYKL